MDEIFGLSMNIIMVVLLILLAICLATVGWVAITKPVIFKLGVRNIPRRKAQTTLIVIGLILSTMIMAAALGVGDTINYSLTNEFYNTFGHVDEQIVASQTTTTGIQTGESKIDGSALATVQKAAAGDTNV